MKPQQISYPVSDLQRVVRAVANGNFVVLDTETTGLGNDAQICQIAVIDSQEQPLINALIRPTCPIPSDASSIHGITDAMVVNAPSWLDFWPQVVRAIDGRDVLIYNAEYDLRLINQSWLACDPAGPLNLGRIQDVCVMLAYAEHVGEWNEYRGSYRWHKLISAAIGSGYKPSKDNRPHGALADCIMTLAVARKLHEVYA